MYGRLGVEAERLVSNVGQRAIVDRPEGRRQLAGSELAPDTALSEQTHDRVLDEHRVPEVDRHSLARQSASYSRLD